MLQIDTNRTFFARDALDLSGAFDTPRANGEVGGASFATAVRQIQDDIERTIRSGFSDSSFVDASSAWEIQRELQAGALAADVETRTGPVDAPRLGGLDWALPDADKQAFVGRLAPLAGVAAGQLGVAPDLLVAQAALESDWGRRPLRDANGRDTHNLFGMKAGSGWDGETADVTTTEYLKGSGVKTVGRFRAYPDEKSAFDDYVRLLQTNPRFSGARQTGANAEAFAQALKSGGYATDPGYARKLTRVAADVAVQKAASSAHEAVAASPARHVSNRGRSGNGNT
ncbi:glucosaminidase domain-containing protein [Burkholderia ubonensis]|uniref:glucosaminidase domain-containing protein n=1 Tax=Burkholderia ubonensis TaxID=101571 RepID=UPI000755FCBE|nr:glucosaminidase domain-containing protein [Burkholderia ubonensis]KWB79417.1 hypothetical protein WL42_12710 [Burkholderia ubonensis]